MFDQASSLRELMRNVQKDNKIIDPKILYQPKIPTVLAISGGKGGVGKTLTTANLGLCMARMGMRTLLIDGDFGLANLDVVLNCYCLIKRWFLISVWPLKHYFRNNVYNIKSFCIALFVRSHIVPNFRIIR